MTITVEIRTTWGQERIYPVCAGAKLFARIANTTTLSQGVIDDIKRLGYRVEVAQTAPATL